MFRGVAGVDEDGDGDGHFAAVNQIIADGGDAVFAAGADEGLAVLEDHEGGGFLGVVLRGDVNPIVPGGVGEDLAGECKRADDFAVRCAFVHLRVGAGEVEVVVGSANCVGATISCQTESQKYYAEVCGHPFKLKVKNEK